MGHSPISFGFSPSLWRVTRPAEMRGLPAHAQSVSPNIPVSDLWRRFLEGGTQNPRREAVVMRLRRMVEHAETEGSRGSYAGWITKLASDDILQRGSYEELGTILPFLEKGGRLDDYEKAVASVLKPKPPVPWPACGPVFFKILSRRLPLSVKAQAVLARSMDLAWPEAESFLEGVRRLERKPERARQLEEALLLVDKSPLAALRIRWLSFLIAKKDPLVRLKLAEVGDSGFRFSGIDGSILLHSAGTQWDAYLDDPSTSALLTEVEKCASSLLAREGAQARVLLSRRLEPKEPFPGPQEVAAAFRRLGDTHSLKIAEAIESEEFILRPEGDSSFDARLTEIERRFQKPMNPKDRNAFYSHPGVLGEKGVLFVRIPSSGLSTSDDLFEVLAAVAHEFQHHEDGLPERESAPEVFRLELKAHLREFLWRAGCGDVDRLRKLSSEGWAGLALRFRDYFEIHYGGLWEQGDHIYSTHMAGSETPEQIRKRVERDHRQAVLERLTAALLPRMAGKTERERSLLAGGLAGMLINTVLPYFAEYASIVQSEPSQRQPGSLKQRFLDRMCGETPAYARQDLISVFDELEKSVVG